jgi:hypothetical protein
MFGWDPFGVAVGVFAGDVVAEFDHAVGAAGQSEFVDVGAAGGHPSCEVMHLGAVAGHGAAGPGAAAVIGQQDQPLFGGGQPLAVVAAQRFVLVEDGQVAAMTGFYAKAGLWLSSC